MKNVSNFSYYYQQQQQIQWQYYKEQEAMTSTSQPTNTPDEQINRMDVDQENEDENDSVCSIVMSTSDENNNSLDTSDLMKNYALMLEVPTSTNVQL